MYEQYFGLKHHPFSMTPDPRVLYLTEQHREALTGLTYAILARKGFVVLTGDAGTGKTTLLARVMEYLPAGRIRSSVILNPTLSASEFLELAMLDFGMTDIPQSKAQRLFKLQEFLVSGEASGQISSLVVDEAHKLSPEVLEEIRLLGNFENANNKLIQILLIGQNELSDVLNREDLRQFKQRIAVRLRLQALSRDDVAHYIEHRWTKAGGGKPSPFGPEVINRVAALARGTPRIINALCDNTLMLAFAKGETNVTMEHLLEAAQDLDLIESRPKQPLAGVSLANEHTVPLGTPLNAQLVSEPPAQPTNASRFQMLERYGNEPQTRPSFWSRWSGRLKSA